MKHMGSNLYNIKRKGEISMKNVFSEFKRGDVWYVHLKTEFGDNNEKSSVQKKSRPYVIVSCEQNNNCSPVINCVPICTRANDHLPSHVYYKYGERDQLVLCEQITTLSVNDFHRNGSHFLYSFNLDFMNEVDKTLAAQLGLTPRVADMKVLENIVEKLAADKEAELKRKYEDRIEERVSVIADRLAKKFGINLTAKDMLDGANYRPEELAFVDKKTRTEMSATIKERTTPQTAKYEGDLSVYADSLTETKSPEPKTTKVDTDIEDKKTEKKKGKTNRKWDNESMKKFLDDYSHLSISVMASKWGMAKKSVASYASIFRKKLEIPKK